MTPPLIAGVELGGTKVFVLRARGTEIVERLLVPTTTPDATLAAVQDILRRWQTEQALSLIHI